MKQKYAILSLGIFLLFLLLVGCIGGGGSVKPPTAICTDSDGGQNFNVVGSVVVSDLGVNSTFNDYCLNSNTLGEYYCKTPNKQAIVSYACSSGQCVNGACVGGTGTINASAPISCIDSDGVNYNVKGNVTVIFSNGIINSYVDYCYGAGGLTEYTCLPNNYSSFQSGSLCSAGYTCVDGACIFQSIPQTCTDTDGGINYYVKGSTNSTNGTEFVDSCSGATLREYFCDGISVTPLAFTCPVGYSCSNGACIVNLTQSSCTDSDGGSNSLVRGTVTITASNGTTTYTDICSTGTSVYEYFCSGNAVSSGSVSCAAGYSCSNGACVAAPACTQSNYCVGSDLYVIYSNCSSSFVLSCANGCNNSTNYCNNTCTDSDGGNNIYVKGTASTGSSTATDFCYSTNSVTEYYCSSQTATALTSLTYVCPIDYSCVTGACVQGNISISQSFSMIPIALMPQFLQILITSPPFDFDNDAQKELITGIFTTSETIFHFREVSSPSSYSLYSPYSIIVDKLYTEKGSLVSFYPADVGDSDEDGLKELITYGRNGNNFSLRVYEQPSLNSFPNTLTYQYPTGYWAEGARIDDLDKDGKKEIIFGGQGPNFMQNIQILENTGNNAYSHVFDVSVSSDSTPQCFNILDDVDNDGKKEVAFTTIKNYPGPSKLYLFESNGDNSLSLSWSYEPRDDKDDVLLNCAALIDLGDTDGDGKKEFLEGGRKVLPSLGYEPFSSVYQVFEANGDNNFQKIAQIKNFNLTYFGDTTANAGDFDGDGKNEIVIANEGMCYGNNVRIYKSVSNNMFAEKWNKTWSTSCNYIQGLDDVGVGDLNGNGKVELLFNEGVYANIYERP